MKPRSLIAALLCSGTGMLGEFIIHVLTGIVYPGYKTIVSYFNLEERNIKKGFDSVIYSADIGIWAYEVKSSRKESLKGSVDSKIKNLIQIARICGVSLLLASCRFGFEGGHFSFSNACPLNDFPLFIFAANRKEYIWFLRIYR
jgi:hypothetical protein